MKLFLASSLDKTMPLLFERIPKPAKETKVLFVENAADPFDSDKKPWVGADRRAFEEFGCELIDIDLKTIAKEELLRQIEDADILHMCGGSIFYLLKLLRERGFGKIIVDSARSNKVLYTGTSAGSIITAASAQLYLHDKEEAGFAKSMKDLSGLGLVNFLIVPHCNNPKYVESNNSMIAENLPEYSQPIFLLYDSQAVWVEDGKLELVEMTE